MTAIATKKKSTPRKYARKSKPEKYIGVQEIGWLPQAQSCQTEYIDEDVAFNFSAFYCAVNGISDDVMILPMHVYRRNGDTRTLYPTHPVSLLFRSGPNPEMDTPTFVKYMVAMRLAWGNGYAEIVRDGMGRVEMLMPIHSRRVSPARLDNGYLYYKVANPDGTEVRVPSDDMLHLKGMTHDGVSGLSVVGYARECIGTALSAEKHMHQFCGNQARPGVIVMTPRRIGPDEERNLRKSFEKYDATGSRYGVMWLEEGTTFKEVGMPHVDAQFLETRVFQIQEFCRWFKLAPNKLAEYSHATFSNIEECNIQHVNDVITPEVVRFESELMRKLIVSPEFTNEDVILKFTLAGLLRGKNKERSEYYQSMINAGIMTINEARALEEMNPIGPDGDKHRVPMNTVAVEDEERIRQEDREAKKAQADAAAEAKAKEPEEEQPAIKAAAKGVIDWAVTRMKKKECKAIRAAVKRFKGDKDGLVGWLDEWHAKHHDELIENLIQPMGVYALLTGRNDPSDMAEYRAEEEINLSRNVIRNMLANSDYEKAINTLVDEWEQSCTKPR